MEYYSQAPDFQAQIAILTHNQGGRTRPPFNGIRWDFRYREDDAKDPGFMIWPLFIDEVMTLIPKNQPLVGTLAALMHIIARQAVPYHKKRLNIGQRFYCVEGSHVVANGIVTKLFL